MSGIPPLLQALIVSLALTLLVEAGLAFLSKKRVGQLLFVVLANIFTNPAVVLTTHYGGTLAFVIAEVLAVLAEGLIYKRSGAGFRRPFLFSLALNLVSCALGLALTVLRRLFAA